MFTLNNETFETVLVPPSPLSSLTSSPPPTTDAIIIAIIIIVRSSIIISIIVTVTQARITITITIIVSAIVVALFILCIHVSLSGHTPRLCPTHTHKPQPKEVSNSSTYTTPRNLLSHTHPGLP